MKRKLILYYISQTVFVVIIPTSPHADQLSVSEYRVSLLDLFFNNKNNNKKKHLKMCFDAIYCTLKSLLSLNVSGYVRSFNCHRVKTVYKVTLYLLLGERGTDHTNYEQR